MVILPPNATSMEIHHADILFPESKLSSYMESYCGMSINATMAYITAEFAADLFPSNGNFVVGLNNIVGDENSPNDRPNIYVNGRLCYSTKYQFFIRAFSVSICT